MKHLQLQPVKTIFKHFRTTGMQIKDDLNQGLLYKGKTSPKMKTSTNLSGGTGTNLVGSHFSRRQKRKFVPPRMNLEDVFRILEVKGVLKKLQPKLPNFAQKGGEYCKYRQVAGHSIDKCSTFKNAVQDLIDPTKFDH